MKKHREEIALQEKLRKKEEKALIQEGKDRLKEEIDKSNNVYEKLVKEFEKDHLLITNKSCYIKTLPDKNIIMSRAKMIVSYEHLVCGKNKNGDDISFIHKWISCNAEKRVKDDVDVFPNNALCPPNIHNLWTPFRVDLLQNKPYTPDIEGRDFVFNHIRILCDNEDSVYDFIIKWFAQMVQFPEVKSIVPTFISKEGSGKSTLLKLPTRMFGQSKILETANPNRDVWGDFNELMIHSYFVNLSEISKKDTKDSINKIKALITDNSLVINNKREGKFIIKSYHRFLITTNSEDPIDTKEGDRRNFIIRSSDEKKETLNILLNLINI